MNNVYLYLIFILIIIILSSIDYFTRKLARNTLNKNISSIRENFAGGTMLCDEKLMKTRMSTDSKEQLNTLCGVGMDSLGMVLYDKVTTVLNGQTQLKVYTTSDLKYFVNPSDHMTKITNTRNIKVLETATPDKKLMKTECINKCILDLNCDYAQTGNEESSESGKCFHYKIGSNDTNISETKYNLFKEEGSIEYSIEFWLKINHKSDNWRNLIHHGNDNGQRYPAIWISNQKGTSLSFRLNTIVDGEEKEQTFTTNSLDEGIWTHNVFTVRNNYIAHYINGIFSREIIVNGDIKWPSDLNTKFYIIDPWHVSGGIEFGYVKWYPLLLNEQYVKNAYDNRPMLTTEWRCHPNINVPIRLSPKDKNDPTYLENPFDVQCMSSNGRDCHWRETAADCNSLLTKIPDPLKPLTCGEEHKKEWGGPGYENPGHWCAVSRDYLSDLDATGACQNYGAESKNLSNSCLGAIWKKAGCITDRTSTYQETGWWKQQTKAQVENDMKAYAKSTKPEDREFCYGSDKSKWPENQAFYDMKNYDRGGYDIRCFPNPSKDKEIYNAEYCKSKCLEDPNCKSANYIVPGGMIWGGVGGCCYKYEAEPKYPIKDINFSIKNNIPRQWNKVSGGLDQVSLDNNYACGVAGDNSIWCNDDPVKDGGNLNWWRVSGLLKNISVNDGRVCGTNSNDDVWCHNDVKNANPNWKLYQGKMKQVDLNGNLLCGVEAGTNKIKCTNYGDENWETKPTPSNMKQINVDGKKAVALSIDGKVYCTEDITVKAPIWKEIKTGSAFESVELSNGKMCGTDSSKLVWCADFNKDNWIQKPGYMKYISIDKDNAYSVNKDGNIFYMNDIHWNAPKSNDVKLNEPKCREVTNPWTIAGYNRTNYLDRQNIVCNDNEVLNSFKLEHRYNPNNDSSNKNMKDKPWKNLSIKDTSLTGADAEYQDARYKYTCCEIQDNTNSIKSTKIVNRETKPDDAGGFDARYMDRHPINCKDIGPIKQMRFLAKYKAYNPELPSDYMYYQYQCNKLDGKNKVDYDCREMNTPEASEHQDLDSLQQVSVSCPPGEAIGNIKYKRTPYNNHFYYNYTCCKPKLT